MRTEVIKAGTIDGAVQQILQELKEDDDAAGGGTASSTTTTRHNVIYFDGWDGLGASAILREVGRRLTTSPDFSQIIHIDCSKWESRRAMQRALAEQLQLPPPVMEMFNAQDEEDDYNGVEQGSRIEIRKVAREIYQHVQKQLSRRFLVIFNNGGREEIDLESLGFPLSGYSRNKALWSFQGGFRLYPRTKVDEALKSTRETTDVVLSAESSSIRDDTFANILRHEAEEVARKMINVGSIDSCAAATNCFLYMMKLCGTDYDLATHGCNCWICDGIIQLQQGDTSTDDGAADTLWQYCDALKHEMQLDADCYQSPHLPSPVVRRLHKRLAYWASPSYGSTLIPHPGHIPDGMFQQYGKLCVLKLSACTFSFKAPPFLCCHSLRFLWLDHCRDESGTDGVGNEEDIQRCFQRLWVLDVRYSSSEFLSAKMMHFMTELRELNVVGQHISMDLLQEQLRNIRKLRATKSGASGSIQLSGKDKMELLDFSGNHGHMYRISVERSCSSLETVIIDGSPVLEKISLKGCAKLKSLLLSGLFPQLRSLDITGTAVKTLGLRAVMAPELDELFLLDCRELRAILWPPPSEDTEKRYPSKLHIETTQKDKESAAADGTGRSPRGCRNHWYISVRDERLLWSLEPVKDYFGPNFAHVEVSAALASPGAAGSKDVGIKCGSGQQVHVYTDHVAAALKDTGMQKQQKEEEANDGETDASARIMFRCPPPPDVPSQGCYMHIQDQVERTITVPTFVCDSAKILHVHDSSLRRIHVAPSDSAWNELEWCRAERCPALECVFSMGPPSRSPEVRFSKLRTIWGSHLLYARCFLEENGVFAPRAIIRPEDIFGSLTMLHLYCCPRLEYALPLQTDIVPTGIDQRHQKWVARVSLENLETLEIMWCDDLLWVFQSMSRCMRKDAELVLPKLMHIHLHELPKLYDIYSNIGAVTAPELKTVKIRGCWNLRSLPVVIREKNVVECDCEKEWWERLKQAPMGHTIDYKPTHPRYYKKTMLKGSPLR